MLFAKNNLIQHLMDCILYIVYRVVQLHVACIDSSSHIIGYSIQVVRQGVSIKCMRLSPLVSAMVIKKKFGSISLSPLH